jgi:uncharacterized membrane protein YdfJ with MMPL/SSD domain
MFGLQIALTMAISALSAISLIPAILVTWTPKFLVRRPWRPLAEEKEHEENRRGR